MTLDIRTILVLFILNNLVIGILFAVSFRGRRSPATDLWITSLIIQSIGWVLFAARGKAPDAASIVLAGTLICLSYSLLIHAFCEFFEFPAKPLWIYLPVGLTLVTFWWNLDSTANRNIAGAFIYGAQFFAAAALFFTRRDRWRGLRFLIGISAVTIATMFIVRGVISFADPSAIPPLPEVTPLQSVTLLIGDIVRLAFSFGFLLLIEARRSDELNRLAALDSLTEAYNRRTFMELAERELARSRRAKLPLGFMLLDLDHFKQINDNHGHLVGDAVLREIKVIADANLRQQDIFGRFGGEEFCVLLPNTDLNGSRVLAERLRANIEKHVVKLANQETLTLTASIGVSAMPAGKDEVEIDNLIEFADLALYQAKKGGRNLVMVEGLTSAGEGAAA